jgi:hypothetical protein
VLAAGWVIISKWYFNALAVVLIGFLIARLLRLDLFQVCFLPSGRGLCYSIHIGPSQHQAVTSSLAHAKVCMLNGWSLRSGVQGTAIG